MSADTANSESLKQLVEQIEQATQPAVMLPEFQRDFVWEMQQTYDLFIAEVEGFTSADTAPLLFHAGGYFALGSRL